MRPSRTTFFMALLVSFAVQGGETNPPPISKDELANRRARVLESLQKESGESRSAFLVLRAPKPDPFAGDVDYLYRSDNDLFYLTGVDEPDAALILSREKIDGLGHAILFVKEPTAMSKRWHGESLDRGGASRRSGIARESVLELKDFPAKLREIVGLDVGRSPPPKATLWCNLGRGFEPGGEMSESYRFLLATFGSRAFHLDLRSSPSLIAPLRQIKSPAEIAHLRKAIDTTCVALRNAMLFVRPGVHEYELRSIIEGTYLRHGCPGWGFPSIVGSGPNSCVLHYQKYDRQSRPGELILMDVGAEYGNYSADITRTVPVDGKFTRRQREIYAAVLASQKSAIELIRPGASWRDVQRKAMHTAGDELVKLGVIENPKDVMKYYLHGCSHGLGLAVHDPMPDRTLAAGMVITIEPGLYFPDEALGVRIEDDVLVTKDGHEVLSACVPKEIEEIEAYLASRGF